MITYLLTSIHIEIIWLHTYKSIYSIFIPNVHKKIQTKRSIYNAYMQTRSYKYLQETKLIDLNMNIIIKLKIWTQASSFRYNKPYFCYKKLYMYYY